VRRAFVLTNALRSAAGAVSDRDSSSKAHGRGDYACGLLTDFQASQGSILTGSPTANVSCLQARLQAGLNDFMTSSSEVNATSLTRTTSLLLEPIMTISDRCAPLKVSVTV